MKTRKPQGLPWMPVLLAGGLAWGHAQGEPLAAAQDRAPNGAASVSVAGSSVGDSCARDLEPIPAFLLENDAGGKDLQALRGDGVLMAALHKARAAAAQAGDEKACLNALNGYLKTWRKGHLWVQSQALVPETDKAPDAVAEVPKPLSRSPSLRLLSKSTALLTLRSFAPAYRDALDQLLKQNRQALQSRPYWVIDVRDNDGGSDSSYAPLSPWLLSHETLTIGPEWLATPANIRAQAQICERYAPGDKTCSDFMARVVDKLKAVPVGSWVVAEDKGPLIYEREARPEPKRPQRVAILMDKECASSCEQFLLDMRQSYQVKLLGRPSAGALDYSNVRPFDLPSGQRQLWYATSRTKRLPAIPVDGVGVLPDIALPQPQDAMAEAQELLQVQRWLEGGSLNAEALTAPLAPIKPPQRKIPAKPSPAAAR